MRALIISNPFKGTLSSKEIGEIVYTSLREKGISSSYIPATDGGDGFLDAYKYINSNAVVKEVMVRLPLTFLKHKVKYLFDPITRTTYISLSDTCGIKYLKEERDVFKANTYGFGEALKHSIINDMPKNVVLGLGGSASVDLGAGFLEALGFKFYDKYHYEIRELCNEKLSLVKYIDDKRLKALIKDIDFKVMLDVSSDIFSKDGAVESFSISKGAKEKDIPKIRENVLSLFNVFKSYYENVSDAKGFGAAGGTSFSMFYALGARLVSGTLEFLDDINFTEIINDYDLIITGEGRVDSQTFEGKLIKGILDNSKNKKVIILCAVNKLSNLDNVYSIVPDIATSEESHNNPKESLYKLVKNISF
ncbi:MAG: glycerate kinase [Gammaproteobacteria bacterium]|nr:glycerate kinase [Gammaproteobacteria bacterium]